MIGKEILNYRIETLIGKGGMGSVYVASNLHINQKVAIKVLNTNLAANASIHERFRQEANNLLALDHPNIVKFLNFVENDEGLFIIMEYVDGITLDDFITQKEGLFVEKRAYEIFDQILSAMTYAHKHNIVHRDIKPSNIILTSDDEGNFIAKILDFGIAKIISKSDEQEKKWIVGTPSYMSPEQVKGEAVDERSDIYSLGVLLHQMLTGRAPYDATTLSELSIQNKVVNETLPRMKEFYPYTSEKVQKIVDKATEKTAKKRFQNCNEFRKAWKNAVHPDPISPIIKYSAVALIALLVGVSLWFWDYNRTKIYYYKDYVEQWGVPQGIGKLGGSDAKHSHRHYRFEYRKYKLHKVSHVNSLDKIISDGESERNERPLDMQLFYGDNGKLSYIKVLDHNAQVLYKKSYNDKLTTVIFQYDDEYSTEKTLSSQTVGYVKSFEEDISEKGKISRWLLEYDQNGFMSKVKYAGFQNILVGDSHGIFGRKYIRDDKGRVIEEHYLGNDESPKATKWGMGIKTFLYDKDDNWIQSEYLTIDREPSYDDADGISVYKMEYDKYGNLILALHCESNGELMLPKKYNVAGVSYSYDNKGFITQMMYLGVDREPCYVPSEGVAGYRAECDANGFFNKQTFIGTDGQICATLAGYSIQKNVNDEKGNALEIWTFDENDQLVETTEGYAGYKMQYDSLGNVIELLVYGTDKNPCLKKDGTAGYRAQYTDLRRISKIVSLDVDMMPCKDKDGTVMWTSEYDKRGNRTKLTYYDETGENLQLSSDGIAGWCSVYDENGNETERSFFDTQNELCLNNEGYAKLIKKYDDRGNQIELMYYDIANKPTVIKKGYAGKKYKYDDRGNIIEALSLGTDGNLAPNKLAVRYKYDKFDNEVEFAVFDKNNNPAMNSLGYFKYVKKYNERNQEVEVCYFGKDNKAILLDGKKYAIVRYEYDNKGNKIQTSFFDVHDKPCINNEGYAIYKNQYDAMGRLIRQTYFDGNGVPTQPAVMVPEALVQYDKWSNRVYIAWADGNGGLIIHPQLGYAVQRSEYDIKGNIISVSYFDKEDKPCEGKTEKYSRKESIYDKENRNTENRYYAANGNLRTSDYAIERAEYNEKGQLCEYSLYNYQEKPVNCSDGYHRYTITYTDEGYYKEQKYYKANNTLFASFTYNPKTEEWKRTDSQQSATREVDNQSEWRTYWQNLIPECPADIGNNMEILSISLPKSNACFVTMRLVEISKYNISDSELQEIKDASIETAKNFKSLSGMPNSAKMTLILVDKAKRELHRVTI